MSSYSSASLSSNEPASSSHSDLPSSPSTSPDTSAPSPLKHFPSSASGHRHQTSHQRTRTQTYPLSPPPPLLVPPAPRTRTLTLDARPHGIGVEPSTLVGKKLSRVHRSRTHPCITLHCADGSAFQLLVVGYDPHHRGVPKVLESDSPVLNPRGAAQSAHADLGLTITHAASITLSDKAFQALPGPSSGAKAGGLEGLAKVGKQREDRWTQRHAAFALKFEQEQGWHCVWATMAEYDEGGPERCVFRNYADVYLDSLHPPTPTPNSAPADRTSHGSIHAQAATQHPDSAANPKPQGRGGPGHGGKGRRRNHKKKTGPGQGQGPANGPQPASSSPPSRSTPRAR